MNVDDQASIVRFDLGRRQRIGLAEAILADVKSVPQIAEAIAQSLAGDMAVLVTRLAPEQFAALPDQQRAGLDYDPVSRTAMSRRIDPAPEVSDVAIVTGGTGDLGVAREAARTLAFHGRASREIVDVGVAGLWRLMAHREVIAEMPVVIVFAGMEGALFSVVGGLARGVVIAVPTSNGYGVAEGGRVALDSALASCAPGIAVSNIDNGYGAACLALRVLGLRGPGGGPASSTATAR
jgi:pyridinium-3,5-biscarboxylic acid mononucleotide synthase